MKVFVTGGNGFIGSYLVKALLDKNYQVRCLLRNTSDINRISKLQFETVIGDILDPESLISGMQGCDAVIHLASISNWADIHNKSVPIVVLQGTENVLRAAVINGKLPTVYFSSSTAIGYSKQSILMNENSSFNLTGKHFSYPIAKHQAEQICLRFHKEGLKVVIVNPTEVYGPYDTEKVTCGALIDFAKESPVLVCDGGTSIVYVEDVAFGAIAALEKGRSGERYILGGDTLTIKELAKCTLDLLELKKKIVSVPNFLTTTIANVGKFLHIPLPFNPEVIPYAVRYWMMDNTKAKTELGVQFRGAIEILKPTLDWLKKSKMI